LISDISYSFNPSNIRNRVLVIKITYKYKLVIMKKFNVIMAAVLIFISSTGVMAQSTGANYFSGKWNMLVKGLPNGDTKMIVLLDKKDTTMTGAILDSVGTETAKFSKVELKDNQVTVYFTAQGYDVYLSMDKKDEDHVTGTMMGMFDAEGTRAKPIK
jgi:hypothetical protein